MLIEIKIGRIDKGVKLNLKDLNKMKILVLIILLIIFLALLFPTKFYITDGGSYGYKAVLYTITFLKSGRDLYPNAEHGVSLHIFPCFNFFWPE